MPLSRALLFPLALVAAPAVARTQVVIASPPAGASVASPAEIRLTLSEPLDARRSGATLTMTGMPGMADHPPMPVSVRSAVAPDGRTLVLKPARKLPAGQYRVDWFTVSGDGQHVTGTHAFGVR